MKFQAQTDEVVGPRPGMKSGSITIGEALPAQIFSACFPFTSATKAVRPAIFQRGSFPVDTREDDTKQSSYLLLLITKCDRGVRPHRPPCGQPTRKQGRHHYRARHSGGRQRIE